MSEFMLSVLITLALLASMLIFVPLLEFCGPRCQRLFLRARRTPPQVTAQEQVDQHRQAA